MFEVEHSDNAALVEERDVELGAGFLVHGAVARILGTSGKLMKLHSRTAAPTRPLGSHLG